MGLYKELNKISLLDFHRDCREAAFHCPQERYDPFEEADILLKEVKKSQVVKYWSESRVLWELGYDEYLSEDSVQIVQEFRIKQLKKKMKKREDKWRD